MIDAHCHLDSPKLHKAIAALLSQARDVGVCGWLVAGVSPETWDAQAAFVEGIDGARCAFGIHPWHAATLSADALAAALESLSKRRGVAVGEFGLDRSGERVESGMERQLAAFRAQLALARELELPVVLHVVRAHGAAFEVLGTDGLPQAGGMVHGFSGSAEVALRYEALGLHVSFSGSVLRPNARRVLGAARAVSESRLLVETDCPDQLPAGRPGPYNAPAWLVDVVQAVAAARGVPNEQVASTTTKNAELLFGSF